MAAAPKFVYNSTSSMSGVYEGRIGSIPRFYSPFSSEIVMYGHCLVTWPWSALTSGHPTGCNLGGGSVCDVAVQPSPDV